MCECKEHTVNTGIADCLVKKCFVNYLELRTYVDVDASTIYTRKYIMEYKRLVKSTKKRHRQGMTCWPDRTGRQHDVSCAKQEVFCVQYLHNDASILPRESTTQTRKWITECKWPSARRSRKGATRVGKRYYCQISSHVVPCLPTEKHQKYKWIRLTTYFLEIADWLTGTHRASHEIQWHLNEIWVPSPTFVKIWGHQLTFEASRLRGLN